MQNGFIMIQRKQSLFLLLSAGASLLLLFFPLIQISTDTALWHLTAFLVQSEGSEEILFKVYPLFALILIVILIPVISIFLYKRRVLQMRLTIYNMILIIGVIAMIALYTLKANAELEGTFRLMYITIMPVLAFVFSFLAFRGIRRDEMLIKTLDRIR